MQPFRFRLQTLLDVSEQSERNLRQELARIRTIEDVARCSFEKALDVWKCWEIKVRESQRGRIQPFRLNELLRGLDSAQRRAIEARRTLQKAEAATEEARARLQEASIKRKSLEKLRERKHGEHAAAASRKETLMFDDMTAVRTAARTRQDSESTSTGVPA